MNPKALYCFLCLLSFAACKRDSAGMDGVAAVLEVADQRVNAGSFGITAEAGTQYVEIKTNVADWIADTGGAAWLTAEPVREPEIPATGVAVVQKLKITASANHAKITRTAAVSINGGGITLTFNIIQAAADDILTFDTPVYAAAGGGTIEIPVAANVAFTVSVPEGCGWIESLTAQEVNVIRLKVGENDGVKSRNADLEVSAEGEGLSKTLTVIQQGAEPAIDIDGGDEIAVAWDDGDLTLNVTANVAYRIELVYETPGSPWIWLSPATRAAVKEAVKEEKFVISANENMEPRKVTVCFVSDDVAVSPPVSREIKVTQGGYTLPPEEVFELSNSAEYYLSSARHSVTVEIRTGKDPETVAVGGAEGWITAAAPPERIRDVLAYTFDAAQNHWPVGRSATLSFAAADKIIEVVVNQSANLANGSPVEYGSVSGDVQGGSAVSLYDCDTGTYLESASSGWPKEWALELKNPRNNLFNRLVYYPVTASSGIGEYELLAFSETHRTWYSVVSGAVPESFYADGAAMSEGYRMNFPDVENAKKLVLRVKNAYGGGDRFGASELHLFCDHSQKIPYPESLYIPSPPATLGHGASSFTVGVAAALPFKVTLDDDGAIPDWIAYDPAASAPGTLVFAVSANHGTQRSATITLTATAGSGLNKSFTVVQAAPFFYLLSPDPAEISLAADPDPALFEIVLATEADPSDITVGPVPYWLTAGNPVRGDSTVIYTFAATANGGDSRNTVLTFTGEGGLTVSVAVRQTGRRFPGVQVRPAQAVWLDRSGNSAYAPETTDGDRNTCHTVTAGNIVHYEFRFADNTDLTRFIYYPRDSDTEHGTFRKIKVLVVSRSGGVGVAEFSVEIPQSVYLTPESRRAGWAVELPSIAKLASHLRITPEQGWQANYSVAEVEFFAPE